MAMLLVMVPGHECCSAVDAAGSAVRKNTVLRGNIESIIPAAFTAKAMNAAIDGLLDGAIRENMCCTVKRLRTSKPTPGRPLKAGKLMVVGTCYDLNGGKVDFFLQS